MFKFKQGQDEIISKGLKFKHYLNSNYRIIRLDLGFLFKKPQGSGANNLEARERVAETFEWKNPSVAEKKLKEKKKRKVL